MNKIIHLISLLLALPLLMTHTMATDAPMDQDYYHGKRSFFFFGMPKNTEVSPPPPVKRLRVDSPVPTLSLDLWYYIYQIDRDNAYNAYKASCLSHQYDAHNLLVVCKGFHNYFWSFRTNVRLCIHASDDTLKFIAEVCPKLITLTMVPMCHNRIYHRPFHHTPDTANKPGHSLLLFTNLQTLSLRRREAVTVEIISQLPNLQHLDLPVSTYKITPYHIIESDREITPDYYQSLKKSLPSLTQLTKLDLGAFPFQDNDISPLQFLKSLGLHATKEITNSGIEKMTNLTSLDLGDNKKITLKGLLPLTKLTHLEMSPYENIVIISQLTPLTQLQQLGFHRLYTSNADVELLTKSLPHLKIEYPS